VESTDRDQLATWLDTEGLEVGAPMTVQPLAGGTSNAMFIVERGRKHWVLRRPARVAIERANEGMRREFQILAALEGTNVPHPSVVALCDDHEVLGCTFFLMDEVVGVNPFPLPDGFSTDRHRSEIANSMIDALAAIHQVDWRGAGLGGLGRPEQFHERQVTRWSAQLDSYRGRKIDGIELVMAWLDSNRPASFDPSLMHGDFHMLNALIGPTPPGRVVAVVDWETATIGDPLLDLAGFCEVWCPVASAGWPSQSDLVNRYCAAMRLDGVGNFEYYQVLYNFRIAVLLEGVFQRSMDDPSRPARNDLADRVLDNVNRAVDLIKHS
jgi:aminoglycoside phosphotransferase (APT) family kinase protein